MILYNTGNYIRLVNENNILFPNRDWVNIEFAGALIATFSWVSGYDECEVYSVQFIITERTIICIPSKPAHHCCLGWDAYGRMLSDYELH